MRSKTGCGPEYSRPLFGAMPGGVWQIRRTNNSTGRPCALWKGRPFSFGERVSMSNAATAFAYNGKYGELVAKKKIGGCCVAVCVSNEGKPEHENIVATHLVQSYEMRMKATDSMDFLGV